MQQGGKQTRKKRATAGCPATTCRGRARFLKFKSKNKLERGGASVIVGITCNDHRHQHHHHHYHHHPCCIRLYFIIQNSSEKQANQEITQSARCGVERAHAQIHPPTTYLLVLFFICRSLVLSFAWRTEHPLLALLFRSRILVTVYEDNRE